MSPPVIGISLLFEAGGTYNKPPMQLVLPHLCAIPQSQASQAAPVGVHILINKEVTMMENRVHPDLSHNNFVLFG